MLHAKENSETSNTVSSEMSDHKYFSFNDVHKNLYKLKPVNLS